MHELLADLDETNVRQLHERGSKIREIVKQGKWPEDLAKEIINKYIELSKMYKMTDVDCAVRSSSTAEDLPDASFAGQQDSFLNVTGNDNLLNAVRNCFASLYTDRAISYRKEMGFEHSKVFLSVCV